jgi:RNA polymerase sigma factor (sigma-70 family)
MTEKEFVVVLKGCKNQHRASQYRLHALLYSYAMHVARRYSTNTEAAEEVANDSFFKLFTKIDQFIPRDGDVQAAFRGWFRRIVINTAIDRCRSSLNTPPSHEWMDNHDVGVEDGLLERLTFGQILQLLEQLPPAYRTVFGLFVADGYSHEEIADLLQISIGTSKSNLSRARQHLKKLLSKEISFNQFV